MKHLIIRLFMVGLLLMGALVQPKAKACREFGFCIEDGKFYWYENWERQGVAGDPKNITDVVFGYERGREIYDPESDGWYWLDSIFNGAKAADKEVWIPYIYQTDLELGINKQGKWVRYNADGKMIKGWYSPVGTDVILYPNQVGNVYFYDWITGEMYKGWRDIQGKSYHFDETTGALDGLQKLDSYDPDLKDFLDQFTLGYAYRDGVMVYSSSNTEINTYNILDSLIAPFLSCVDYRQYPGLDVVVDMEGYDPRGWFKGYKKYDGFKIDWIRENVLNLSEHDFERLLQIEEQGQYCYRHVEQNDHSYYCEYPITGLEGHMPSIEFTAVHACNDIAVVDYDVYRWDWNDELMDYVRETHPFGSYQAVMLRKSFNSTDYWSLLTNGMLPVG